MVDCDIVAHTIPKLINTLLKMCYEIIFPWRFEEIPWRRNHEGASKNHIYTTRNTRRKIGSPIMILGFETSKLIKIVKYVAFLYIITSKIQVL